MGCCEGRADHVEGEVMMQYKPQDIISVEIFWRDQMRAEPPAQRFIARWLERTSLQQVLDAVEYLAPQVLSGRMSSESAAKIMSAETRKLAEQPTT